MDVKLITPKLVELLERNGALKFDDLHKRIKKTNKDFTENDLNTLLMKLEIRGLVKVYRIPRGKRRVELV
jgi:ABC-type metal ion transport system substrate-binding protein